MSLRLQKLAAETTGKKSRSKLLALAPALVYDDGRTKQCFADECNIEKIMARFETTGTISHLQKFEGVYADFSDFDFHEQNNMLSRGNEIFAELPAEIRREFLQDPAEFFKYVNDPANAENLREKLPALAKPGRQLPKTSPPTADAEAAEAAAIVPAADPPPPAE